MLRDEFVLSDVDKEVLFHEDLHDERVQGRNDFLGGAGDGDRGDEDAAGKVVLVEGVTEVPQLLDADVLVAVELDPDSADLFVGLARIE